MKKPFACCFFAFGFTLLASLSACRSNPNMQTMGESYLQGEWQQDSVPGQRRLLSYALYHLKFSCDSFFVSVNAFSKVNNGTNGCMNAGHWHEYMRGTYQQISDTLHLKGQFANPDFTVKDDKGCFRSGDYEEFFKVIKQPGNRLTFASTTSIVPVATHLVRSLSCKPKPL